jgi:hypothetical protein
MHANGHKSATWELSADSHHRGRLTRLEKNAYPATKEDDGADGKGRLFFDRVFAQFAQILRIGRDVEIIALEFKTHVVFADIPAIRDGDFHGLIRAECLTAKDIVFPFVDANRRSVEIVEYRIRAILQREDQVLRMRDTGRQQHR